jgi:O-antigen biosynthesis protein
MNTIPQRKTSVIHILREQGPVALFEKISMFVEARAHRLFRNIQRIRTQTIVQEQWPLEKPLVSVIIPCYNYGMFIKEAINSVLAQTFQRFEILVIDDGSTDVLTKNVLRNLRYDKMKIIHQENQGLARTRNIGATLAAGKYLCYLDADDEIEPTYLEETLSVLESDASLGSCYSWVRCFGDIDSIWETQDLDPFFLRQRTTAPSHSVIRKEAWERVKELNGAGFLTRYDGYFEDWVFWIDMVQCGYRGQVIREPLIRYRVHKTSLGATHKPGWKKMLPVLHEDRKEFFGDRSYRKRLEKSLNKRIYIRNNRINLSSLSFYKSGRIPL